ncbi:phospholipase A [Comamonas sp. GB3 AK4-5]|uniref:phospholipase A n=1 Tax=Comamonas sp. GB3 AK4-5 TaxID=3231487 RepID=UPI00351ED1C7
MPATAHQPSTDKHPLWLHRCLQHLSVWALATGLTLICSGATYAADHTWQQCAATSDNQARLACFDSWAQQQQPLTPPPATAWTAPPASANAQPAPTLQQAANAPMAVADVAGQGLQSTNGGCRDPRYSEVSRFFELEPGTDCGTFSLRGYRPMSVSLTTADHVNEQPSTPGKPASTSEPYQKQEMRIQLSARTKLASGLLTDSSSGLKDSLWVGYTQQSYWQVFNADISRPFRTTDHEPEIFYIYPTTAQLPFGWRWRYSGVGLAHQSNGQSDPLSRSWNRWYVLTGAELDNRWQVHAKLWQRIKESPNNDDNPGIQDDIGRGELKLGWNVNQHNYLGLTARGSLGKGRGSGRIEWLRTLGEGWNGGKSNLRLHVQLFSGYGDSLIDYNYKRTMFSVGLSLLDF